MKILILKGEDINKDKNILFDNIDDAEAVFVLDNSNIKLCEYIDSLDLHNSEELYTMKICKEIRNIDVCYQNKHYSKFSDLLIDINQEIESEIVVKGDLDESRKDAVRTQLSAIVQQFVYLNIPLGKIQVVTEKEAKNLEIIKRYEANLTLYESLSKRVYDQVAAKNFPNNEELKNKVLTSLKKIQDYISESRLSELRVAVAASKKSGKSVVVNSMLECELAPTSLELATPNTCVYKKSDRYYLKYKGKTNFFDTPQQVKDYLLPLFKGAEFDEANSYAIDDMEIGYIPKNDRLPSLTIYDTPGPDLAGVENSQKKSAERAISVTDVCIFPIDYSKYLTDNEAKWLKSIREVFSKNNKYYSLIFDINKTDQRFIAEGDKCQVRVIDFIREKLISIAPEFKDSIVFGTSALTYFNALETPKIEGFEDLETVEMENLDFEIGMRMHNHKLNGEQKTKLQSLKQQVDNAHTFMNWKLNNLQQVKQFSGMPDLLNYVQYVTRNKARDERLNKLMRNIDEEIVSIWNLFKFTDLENQLAENKEKLDKAKTLLETFKNEVNAIYDDTYPDIVEKATREKLSSTALRLGFKKKNADLKKLSVFVREAFIDSEFNEQNCLNQVVKFNFRALYQSELKCHFEKSEEFRKDEKALREKEIRDIFYYLVKNRFKGIITDYITTQISNCTDELKNETKLIHNDLVQIVNERQHKLESSIYKLKTSLKSDCNIDFDIKTPTIDFAFKYSGEATPRHLDINSIGYDDIWRALEKTFGDATPLSDSTSFGFIKNILSKIGLVKISDVAISLERNMEVYDNDFQPMLIESVKDSLKTELANTKDTLTKLVENVVNDIIDQMKTARENGIENSARASSAIDNTRALAENIERLKEQKQNLVEIKACVEPLQIQWSEIIKTE